MNGNWQALAHQSSDCVDLDGAVRALCVTLMAPSSEYRQEVARSATAYRMGEITSFLPAERSVALIKEKAAARYSLRGRG
jgi:hypothetical protein